MRPWLGTPSEAKPAALRGPARGHVAAIDALRAVAVLAVVAFHMQASWLPGGFAGVDVFLVISGYVISRSMLDLDSSGLLRFAAAFYARRARRILPALLVCLTVVCVATTLIIPDSWLAQTNHLTASYAFWGLSNYFMMNYGDPYFAPRIDFNPSAHTWSLGVEEQFYWLYPLVFFSWLKLRTRTDAGRLIAHVMLAAVTLGSLVYSAYLTARSPADAYYSLPSRFWELGVGALLFQFHATRTPADRARGAQLWISFGLIAAGLVFSREASFPMPWALVAVLGTAGAIDAAVMAGGGRPVRVLSAAVPVWIGTRSYSLYLWHWPVYVLFRWTVGLESLAARIAAVALIAAFAEASYRWVETPFRRGFRTVPPLAIIASALSCVLVLWLAADALDKHRHLFSLSVTRQARIWYPADWAAEESPGGGCHVSRFYEPFAGGALLKSRRSGCQGHDVQLFVTGNSHALAYTTLLARLTREQPYEVAMYYRSDCAFMELDMALREETPACRAFYAALLADIAKHARPRDVLFLPSLRLPRLGDQWATYSEGTVKREWHDLRAAQPTALAEAARTLKFLGTRGLRVVFEAPKPIFRSPPFRCSDWFNRRNPVCAAGLSMPRAVMLAYRQPVLQAMETLEGNFVSIWDPFDSLCPNATCEALRQGTPLFFDGDHLSGYGNELVYPGFLEFLRAASQLQQTPLRPAVDTPRPHT